MTSSGPKVLEYNVRFGDPETQTVIPLLDAKCDLAEIMLACTSGWLDAIEMKVQQLYATTVILAAGGYPGSYAKGNEIKIGPMDAETHVFHAGTDRKNDRLVTAGGRVIAVTATGSSLKQAVARAYEGVKSIKFDNMVFRTDIAHRALASRPQIPRGLTYADAGVSIAAGASLVDRIKAAVKSTRRPGADAEIGGFGGAFDLSAAGWGQDTIILGAIDGVGTKLKIAQAMKRHDTVGIDLVAMNVNDLVVQGAESLFFLDCFSCGSLDIDTAAEFVMGVAEGCKLAGCALIGGETAEMPGMYQGEDYDAVGAAIGAVKKTKILPRTSQMKAGDLIIGLASSGLHSNGFSLVRKIIERSELSYTSAAPWNPARSVGEELLSPTTIYAKALPPFLQHDFVHGLAHITGGGLLENVPRVLPDHLAAAVDTGSWQRPAVFEWLQKNGGVSEGECFKTWNMGIGMVLVCDPAVERHLAELDRSYAARIIGRLVERSEHPGCFLTNSLAT